MPCKPQTSHTDFGSNLPWKLDAKIVHAIPNWEQAFAAMPLVCIGFGSRNPLQLFYGRRKHHWPFWIHSLFWAEFVVHKLLVRSLIVKRMSMPCKCEWLSDCLPLLTVKYMTTRTIQSFAHHITVNLAFFTGHRFLYVSDIDIEAPLIYKYLWPVAGALWGSRLRFNDNKQQFKRRGIWWK